jgi:hypothetical protein
VGDLREHEALRLLADWARVDPTELPPEAAMLAREFGYLPFALAINGSMVRRGTSWKDLLAVMAEHELDFAEAQEHMAHYPYLDVFRAIRRAWPNWNATTLKRRRGSPNCRRSTGARRAHACDRPLLDSQWWRAQRAQGSQAPYSVWPTGRCCASTATAHGSTTSSSTIWSPPVPIH